MRKHKKENPNDAQKDMVQKESLQEKVDGIKNDK